MSDPVLAPRNPLMGLSIPWVVSLLAGIAIGIFVPGEWRVHWLLIAFGGSALLSFAVQLRSGQTQGFIFRVAASVLGCLLLLGAVSIAVGLIALVPA